MKSNNAHYCCAKCCVDLMCSVCTCDAPKGITECWINPDPKHPEDWFSTLKKPGWVRFTPALKDQK